MPSRVAADRLTDFVTCALRTADVADSDAALTARVLVEADVRGIDSHGVARLESLYLERLRNGMITPNPQVRVVHETPLSVVLDADSGLGPPVGERAMRTCIEKARASGVGFATVRHSNHFGIAGHYSMMALEHDMIGIASTIASRMVVPANGRELLLGTNPLSFAIPAGRELPFVLDMATATVARGKLEVAARNGKGIPSGWAVDAEGQSTTDPAAGLEGALLPLGGYGTQTGGHKGYGLGLLAEILCGPLAGAAFGRTVPRWADPPRPPDVGHFFGAMRIDLFRPVAEFKAAMDECLHTMRTSQPVPGQTAVQVAGDPEHWTAEERRRDGIPLAPKVVESLRRVAAQTRVAWVGD
jgi:LDH2 family malate/lactate/ureidoglycolate dehydrogenase